MSEKNVIKRKIYRLLRIMLEEKGINIYKIIFFGSFAKNTQRKDSDIDIIIVSKDFRNKNIFERIEYTIGINRKLVRQFKKPFDIIYYSDEEWEKGNSLLIHSAKIEGEVIYSSVF